MPKKVLIVDDMPQWLRFHAQAVVNIFSETDEEVELRTKSSAKEAYEEVYSNINAPFDLIITDLQMEQDYEPEHAGEWFVRNVRRLKQYNNTPIIIISASYDIKSVAQRLNADYLSKNSVVHNPISYKLKVEEVLNR